MSTTASDQEIVAALTKKIGAFLKTPEYDDNGNLIRLSLAGLDLSQVPVELEQLINLQELDLNNNQLTQVPEELGQLTNLQMLDLSDNQLTQVPVELGQLTSLQELYLSRNKLTGVPVELGRLTNLQMLDLNNNRLSEVPEELGQLTSLQELYLSDNQLTQVPEELGQLASLRMLNLNNNRLTQVPVELGQLSSLRQLYLNNNQLTRVPAELGQLANLQMLDLFKNKLTQVPEELGRLTSLRQLSLGNNQLVQVPVELGRLTNLQELYLFGNQLTQVPVELGQLANLQTLNLNNNRLSQVPVELGQLASLQELYLHGNRLRQVPTGLRRLISLRQLYLYSNQLSQVPVELGQLTSLQVLDLHNNKLSQVPVELGQLTSLHTLNLDDNPDLLTVPPEIVARGTTATLSFLRELQVDSFTRYEAKLLVVGEGGTGKSSLLRALRHEGFVPGLPMTHGIGVDRLRLPHPEQPALEITLNTWDFGGQQIYHATHQFFLTKRSLYLVVWNAIMGPQQCRLDFWLETIRSLAPDSPVLLIATHTDELAPDLNYQLYKDAFPQLVGAFSVSNKNGTGLDELKAALTRQAVKLPLMGQRWPAFWVEAERALLARKEHHIDIGEYVRLCADKGIQAEIAKGTLGSYLHDLGKILYFRDDDVLCNMVILKPNWVTKAISCVLEDEATKKAKAILAHSEFARVWATDEDKRPYDPQLYPIFLRLMERFDLSYQIEADPGTRPTKSLVPQLLPHQPPSGVPPWPTTPVAGQVQVEMVYRFDFVPAGIMSWFIVRTHRYTKRLHWREGVVLAYEDHYARVELNPMLREIRLMAWGLQPYNFFTILKHTLDLILTRFEGLQVKREVPCICHRQTNSDIPCKEVYRYEEDLVRRMKAGKQTIQCPASYSDVSVLELLYGIHVSTDSQMIADIQKGQQEALWRLATLQQTDALLLKKLAQQSEWILRSFTRQWNLEMQKIEAECPNMFFLVPGTNKPFNPKQWIGHSYQLFLICQYPRDPHRVGDGYDLRKARKWWVAVSPWLRHLITLLKFGVPMGHAISVAVDAVDVKQWEAQIELLEKITEDLQDISMIDNMSRKELSPHTGKNRLEGPALRALHSFLVEADPGRYWGGLYKTSTPDGNILWLCGTHREEYKANPLS